MSEACPGTEQLERLLRETLAEAEQTAVLQHLDLCGACRHHLEQLAGSPAWLSSAAPTPGGGTPSPVRLEQLMKQFRSQPPATKRIEATGSSLDFLQPSQEAGVLGLLGSYEVIEEIDRGAMGIVFKARDTTLDRIVAIKVLAPAIAHDAAARARFLREARAAAAIAHEHVITIHAVEETTKVPYLVMQFVPGRSLRQRLAATGPLRVEEILRIGFQIASSLAAAHRLGLIHRDIKPSNILLENSVERVKITDFGLARAVDDTALTLPGHIAGTPEYMAPEQARGDAVDQRADLFSLGCVLYEMATDVSPFRAPTTLASLRNVCEKEQPPAHAVNPAVPEWLSRIISGLLTKDPAQRTSSAGALAEELGAYLAQVQQPIRPEHTLPAGAGQRTAPPRRPRSLVWSIAAAVVVLVCSTMSWLILREKQHSQRGPFAPGERFVITSGVTGSARRFGTLSDAVKAAVPGATIECRFNGEVAMAPLALENKPLILRAAPEFKPVLVAEASAQPLLTTHAALVVEGLTFKGAGFAAKTPSSPPPRENPAGPGEPPPRRAHRVMFIKSNGAGLMVANCRFLVAGQPASAMQEGPTAILTENCPFSHFENCMFDGPSGRAIESYWGQNAVGAVKIAVRNCAQFGSDFLSLIAEAKIDLSLELWRNTIAGEAVIHSGHSPAAPPLSVDAARNVFDVDAIHRRDLFVPEDQKLRDVLRWADNRNVYSVQGAFARAKAEVKSFDDWKRLWQIAAGSSFETRLGLFDRLQKRLGAVDQHVAADFQLMPQELTGMKDLSEPIADLGADLTLVGPGAEYAAWRRLTQRYQEWLELARQKGFAP